MKAVGVVRHLFYTSKIKLIVLELNHLIYKHVYCIYSMKALGVVRLSFKNIVDILYFKNGSCWCGLTLILYFKNGVDSSGTKPFDI